MKIDSVNDVCFCVLTTINNVERQHMIMQTWGKRVSNLFFFTDHMSKAINADQMGVTMDTRYRSNEIKVVAGLNRVFTVPSLDALKPNFTWVLLLDDDTIPNLHAIGHAISSPTFNREAVHGRMMYGACPLDRLLDYPSGGAGTLFPTAIIPNLKYPTIENTGSGYADVSCGIWLNINEIPIQYAPFRPFHPSKYGLDIFDENHRCLLKNQWSFHYVSLATEVSRLDEVFHGEATPKALPSQT